MNLTIDSLKTMGAFTGAPVEREVTWKQNGEEFTATVYVKPLSYSTAISDIMASAKKTDAIAGRIAASIVDEKGFPVFTVEDITGTASADRGALSESLTLALLTVIGEVNGAKKKK